MTGTYVIAGMTQVLISVFHNGINPSTNIGGFSFKVEDNLRPFSVSSILTDVDSIAVVDFTQFEAMATNALMEYNPKQSYFFKHDRLRNFDSATVTCTIQRKGKTLSQSFDISSSLEYNKITLDFGDFTISLEYTIVQPFGGRVPTFDMYDELIRQWGSMSGAMMGHRGMGTTLNEHPQGDLSYVENTIDAFNAVARHNGVGIEFDITILKDGEAVIYHDMLIVEKKLVVEEERFILMPINAYTKSELLDPNRKFYSSAVMEDRENPDRYRIAVPVFPTLEELFEDVNPDLFFNAEVKYPLVFENGVSQAPLYHEFTGFADRILTAVFKVYQKYPGRRLALSTFHPELAMAFQMKQRHLPVYLISKGTGQVSPLYMSPICQRQAACVAYATMFNMTGVAAHSTDFLSTPELRKSVVDNGLKLMTWGALNNDLDKCEQQKSFVNGIMTDKLSTFYTESNGTRIVSPNQWSLLGPLIFSIGAGAYFMRRHFEM